MTDSGNVKWRRAVTALPAWVTSTTVLLVLGLLVAYPLGMLLLGAVSGASPRDISLLDPQLTATHLSRMGKSELVQRAVVVSLIASILGTVVAHLFGLFFAWTVARTKSGRGRSLEIIAILPLFLSPLLAGIAWSTLGTPHAGLINVVFRDLGINWQMNVGDLQWVAIIMGISYAPYAYLLCVGAFRNIDAQLEEAARVCGAPPRVVARRVVLPLLTPAITSSVLLVFVTLLTVYSIPFMLAEPNNLNFMTTYLWRLLAQSPAQYQAAAVLGLALTILVIAGLGASKWLMRGRSFVTVSGKTRAAAPLGLGRWRILVWIVAAGYAFLGLVLPYFALLQRVLRPRFIITSIGGLFDFSTLSLTNVRSLWEDPGLSRAISNSIQVGLGTSFFGLVFCFLLAYTLALTKLPGRGLMEAISSVPLAVPGLIIGVAYLWAWISLPGGLYGTLWILILAYIARYIPDATRTISATLVQLGPELEEAARTVGASRFTAIRRVTLPLSKGGLFAAGVLLFVLSVRELGSALFLYTSQTNVMSVEVLVKWRTGQIGEAGALAFAQAIVLFLPVIFMRRLAGLSQGRA